MTEQEYIDATNLAKVRAAKDILRDLFATTGVQEAEVLAAMNAMSKIEDDLYQRLAPKFIA